ncbi:hypothetical protein WP1_093 [Pseudomonas phage WP1]
MKFTSAQASSLRMKSASACVTIRAPATVDSPTIRPKPSRAWLRKTWPNSKRPVRSRRRRKARPNEPKPSGRRRRRRRPSSGRATRY